MAVAMNISGTRYGRLVAIEVHSRGKARGVRWLCRCDCGKETIATVHSLRSGNTRSCGCLFLELASERARSRTRHGLRYSPEYYIWRSMRSRCNNPKASGYQYWGGRGIKVCARWEASFEAFYEDMGPRPDGHSIDRIDVNGDYEPGNCRWAIQTQQNRNKRNTTYLTYLGRTLCVAEWAQEIGASTSTLHGRILRGWSVEKTLTAPIRGVSK